MDVLIYSRIDEFVPRFPCVFWLGLGSGTRTSHGFRGVVQLRHCVVPEAEDLGEVFGTALCEPGSGAICRDLFLGEKTDMTSTDTECTGEIL